MKAGNSDRESMSVSTGHGGPVPKTLDHRVLHFDALAKNDAASLKNSRSFFTRARKQRGSRDLRRLLALRTAGAVPENPNFPGTQPLATHASNLLRRFSKTQLEVPILNRLVTSHDTLNSHIETIARRAYAAPAVRCDSHVQMRLPARMEGRSTA
jgi:hypothetical protein